jgi:hypothetical protein
VTEQGVGVVRPLPGEGVVAHLNGLLLVCAAADQPVEELLGALRETAAGGGDGRALARRVAQVLARAMDRSITAEPVTCAVAGPAGGGVAVLVSGAATATVSGGPDGEVRLAGRDALTWTDRLVNGPVTKIELRLPGAGPSSPYARLDGGVVAGAGVVLEYTQSGEVAFPPAPPPPPRPQTQSPPITPPPPEPIAAREPVIPPPPMPPMPPPPPAGPPSEPIPVVEVSADPVPSGPTPTGPVPTGPNPTGPNPTGPVPMGPSPTGPVPSPVSQPMVTAEDHLPQQNGVPGQPYEPVPPVPGADEDPGEATQLDTTPEPGSLAMVYGVDCKNDHFNDPRVPYCAVCGIALVQRTLVPYKGPRPPLGVLLLDDGMTLRLDTDYVLGRDPERASEVQSGEARPARVTSPDGSVSRRHLRVALDGWDVNLVDLGSVNGTQIQPPGDPNFYDIPPNENVPILPGTTVRIGVSRTMRYESHRNA